MRSSNEAAGGAPPAPFEMVDFDAARCAAPLPRAYQWADGSAYVNHVELVRRARGAEMPASFWTEPLMYQGGSDTFLGARDAIVLAEEAWGIDLEGEVAVITDDVPMGASAEEAGERICLLMLVNDVSLRNLIPAELAKGFGFFHGKPSTAFSPVAVTPDELGPAWRDGKVHLPLLGIHQRQAAGPAQCGRRHDVLVPAADRACRQDAAAGGRHHRRLGDGLQQGRRRAGQAESRKAAPATPAWPSCARWRRCSRASRRRRFSRSATASASRCWMRLAAPSSAPSTRKWCDT